MSNPTVVLPGCCPPSCPSPVTVNIPGSPGVEGDPGNDGIDGFDSYTTLSNSFTTPASGASVTVSVANSLWAVPGQVIFIQFAGYYEVLSKPNSFSMVVENLGYNGNAAAGTLIPASAQVGPAGLKGVDGDSADALNDISPTTGKGQLLVDNGANTPDSSMVALAAGTNGRFLKANSGVAAGVEWVKVDLSDSTSVETGGMSGLLRASGGTLAATDTLTSALTVNNTLTADRTVMTQETVAYAATTNIDFNGKGHQTVSLTGNVTFTTSNRGAGKMVLVRIISDASIRTYTLPAWVFVGAAAPASIAASKTGLLQLWCFGAADTDIVARYLEQP